MIYFARLGFAVVTLSILSVLLSGCGMDIFPASGPAEPLTIVNDAPTISYPGLVHMAPPTPRLEAAQQPSNPRTEIWRAGYWTYNGGSFDWVPGLLVARPSPTAVWSPEHWLQHDYGWAFVPGYWL